MPTRDGTGPNRNGQIRNSSQPQQGNRFRNNNGIELGRGRNRNYNDDRLWEYGQRNYSNAIWRC